MKEEFAQLAHAYDPSTDYTGWYMSRKMNGWGCMWDGGVTRDKIATSIPWYYEGGDHRFKEPVISTGLWTIGRADKHGPRPKVINAPRWFLDNLPVGVPMQGELWADDNLAKVKSICGQGVKGRGDVRWSEIAFMVYNSKPYCLWPSITRFVKADNIFYNNYAWSLRMKRLENEVKLCPSFYEVGWITEQTRVENRTHLSGVAMQAVQDGWEGLMLVNPNGYYEAARSNNLLKVKPEFETEATVIDYHLGEKRHEGRMGAVGCELTWDEKVVGFTGGTKDMIGKTVRFKVGGGYSDAEREWASVKERFPIGGEIHFTFLGVSNDGVPVHANAIR